MIKIKNPTALKDRLYSVINNYSDLINTLIATGTEGYYKKFYIPKRGGGERSIEASSNVTLKSLQKKLNYLFSSELIFSDCVTGFVKKRSIITNAQIHLGAELIINIDLKDFFNSIKKSRIYNTFTSNPFNYPDDLANILSTIATKSNYLPQGSPLSPIISNIVASKLDRSLTEFCLRKNIKYSRYADDMSFSISKGRIEEEEIMNIRKEIEKSGFQINENKYKIKRKTQGLAVTGIIVNEKLNVRRIYIKNIKAMLHNWEKNDSQKARVSSNRLRGKIEFVGMVRGKDDHIYRGFLDKFNYLNHKPLESSDPNQNIASVSAEEFEDLSSCVFPF